MNRMKAFSKKYVYTYIYIYIFVSARFTAWISNLLLPVLSTEWKRTNGEGRKKKERKKEGKERIEALQRIEIVHRLVDRRPTYT